MLPPKRPSIENDSVPHLEFGSSVRAHGDAGGTVLRIIPASARWAGLLTLIAALAAAAAVFVVIHRSHAHAAATAARPTTIAAPAAATGAGRRAEIVHTRTPTPTPTAPAADYSHDLTSSDLVSLTDGATSYTPPAYLAAAYRAAAAPYGLQWHLLAALEYIQGGYMSATVGAGSTAEQALASQVGVDDQRAVNPHVLAGAVSSTSDPSAELTALAGQLAADDAATSPAKALSTYLKGSGVDAATVLTLAQEIGSAGVTSKSGPMLRLTAMEDEAQLLNGLPYVWGGGHTDPAWVVGSGYDCSGFVSEVLHAGGVLDSPDTTQDLPDSAGITTGPGHYVTMYDRTDGGLKEWEAERAAFLKKEEAANPTTQGVHVVTTDTGSGADMNTGAGADASSGADTTGGTDTTSGADPTSGSDTNTGAGASAAADASASPAVNIQLPPALLHPPVFNVNKPNPDNSLDDDHVIIDLDGQWWESGGDSADGGAAQVHRIAKPDSGYLQSFNVILHPVGM